MIHSLNSKRDVLILSFEDINHCRAVFGNKLFTACLLYTAPNQRLIEFMESNNEPYQYSEKVRNDWELIEEITALSPSDRDDIIELIEFFVWKNQQKKSHIA